MSFLWDYDEKELKKTRQGRIFLLERMINYGVFLRDKIKPRRRDIKKYWKKLSLEPSRRNFLRFVLWGK